MKNIELGVFMEVSELVGLAAGFFTTMSLFPQVIKSYRSKSTKDLSWGWLAAFTLGVLLWLAYGLMIDSTPVTIANIATTSLLSVLIFLKLKHG